MADFVICPRCRRQNPADAVFCNRCGVRLLNAGVYYNRRDASSTVGIGQLVLGLGVLVLAGIVLGGGAIVLLGSSPKATPTHVATGPTPSDQPLNTPTLSAVPSSTLFSLPPTPTLLNTATPTVAPTITATPSPVATPTPQPTPSPTPVDCAVTSTGIDVRTLVLGYGNPSSRNPTAKIWCIRDITIHPVFDAGVTGYGTATLLRGTKKFDDATYTCGTSTCGDAPFTYVPPRLLPAGSTLRYQFVCQNSDETIDDDCADLIADGMTITIHYEVVGP